MSCSVLVKVNPPTRNTNLNDHFSRFVQLGPVTTSDEKVTTSDEKETKLLLNISRVTISDEKETKLLLNISRVTTSEYK